MLHLITLVPPSNILDSEGDSDTSDDNMTSDIGHLSKGLLNARIFITEDLDHTSSTKWNSGKLNTSLNLPEIQWQDELAKKYRELEFPMEFFKIFFSDDLLEAIKCFSEHYSLRKYNQALNLTTDELRIVIGGLILSGYCKLPNKRLYWSLEEDCPKILKNSISRNRYFKILSCIHFCDKMQENDKLAKIRPLISHMQEKFRSSFPITEFLSIDESMIPYYGKHRFKQFIRGNPIRSGYKSWNIASSIGYTYFFDIYTGKNEKYNAKFGLGGTVVQELLSKIQCNPKNHCIVFDNFFASENLLHHLKNEKWNVLGTLGKNRFPKPLKQEQIKKGRGNIKFHNNGSLQITQWYDNNAVAIISTFGSDKIENVKRFIKSKTRYENVEIPEIMKLYNFNMGGVDIIDQSVSTYRSNIKVKKWYWPIFLYLLDASISNAWQIYRYSKNDISLLEFRRNIALSLLNTNSSHRSDYSKRSVKDFSRYDGQQHYIEKIEKQKRCAYCSKKTLYICSKCKVGLNIDCFKNYHEK